MSLHRLPRLYCRSCGRGLPLLPDFGISGTPTTNTSPTPSTTRRHVSSKRRAPVWASPAAKKRVYNYGVDRHLERSRKEMDTRYNDIRDNFEKNYEAIYIDSRKAGVIDSKIGKETYLEIGRRLIYQAFNHDYTAAAVKTIYPGDPNRVSDVAYSILHASPWDRQVIAWARKATARAGVIISLVGEIESQKKNSGGIPPMSNEISLVKKIAYETNDPVALRVWADIAWLWGQKKEALDILHKLDKITYPSNIAPRVRDDITLSGLFKPPWESLAEIYNLEKKFDEADEMMKVGALVYRDPHALIGYAYLRKEEGDWEAYEQCMVTVAMSSHDEAVAEACFRLANYYYLIHKGEIPSRDELAKKRNLLGATVSKFLGLTRTKEEWRKLAINWYEAATCFGYFPAIRNYVVLLREDGAYAAAESAMEQLKNDGNLWESSNIKRLRNSFNDPSFQPALPASWLEL